MTERDLEKRLRAWYQPETGEDQYAPSSLRARVAVIPDVALPGALSAGQRRLLLIAAMAMLGGLLIGSAIAVGSGWLRLPLPQDTSNSLSFADEPLFTCGRTLDDGLLLRYVTPGSGDLPREGGQLHLYADGLLVRGPGDEYPAGVDASWSQRRLAPRGVESMLDAVRRADLPDCRTVNDGSVTQGDRTLRARVGGEVLSISIGDGSYGELRPTTPEESESARSLITQLEDPDSWIAADAWIDQQWQPYVPERWELQISIDSGGSGECAVQAYGCLPSGRDIVLPDGSSLVTFGEYFPLRWVEEDSFRPAYRCGVVSTADAEEIAAMLDIASDNIDGAGRTFAYGNDELRVSMDGLLPHQTGCEDFAVTAPTPAPSPAADLVVPANACDYLPSSVVEEWPSQFPGHGEHWSACFYFSRGAPDLVLSVRTRRTTAKEAASYVRSLFGDQEIIPQEIASGTAWFNGCGSPAAGCASAVAVSAEPYLFVIQSEGDLRILAEALIRRSVSDETPRR